MQGLAGGGLQPSSQGILIDAFPQEKQGAAMTLFGVAALLAPVVGPTLGGWITVQYEWRWIFYINIPVGLVALAACHFLVEDPEYLKAERAAAEGRKARFDTIGLGLLVIAMASWEVVLSKGQEWDWLGDPFGRVQTLALLFAVCLVGLIVWESVRRARSSISAPSWNGISPSPVCSFSPPTPSCWGQARRCPACCNRFSATTPWHRAWSCRPRAFPRSCSCRSSGSCLAGGWTPDG